MLVSRSRPHHQQLLTAAETVTRRSVLSASAIAALAAPAWACPTCSLSQGIDTLVYILAFLVVPYVIVAGTFVWIKRILKSEQS